MQLIERLKHCVACDNDYLIPLLDLGNQPLANSYKKDRNEFQCEYPLAINYCSRCFHVQLTHAVNPKIMFEDYAYVSGTSKTMHSYMESFANKICGLFPHPGWVLDVGCNDGTQLDYFKKNLWETEGIEPAKNLADFSRSKNHHVINDFFRPGVYPQGYKVNLIIAQNVFAHTANPLEFLETAKNLIQYNGFIIIQTSQADMINNGEFDTIYHEHISFFNTKSMKTLVERAGLYLIDVWKESIHGGSYVFVISPRPGLSDSVDKMIRRETFLNHSAMQGFANNSKKMALKIRTFFEYHQAFGWAGKIIGYGAPAKDMTLLNYAKPPIDYLIDDNPLKQIKYAPGSSLFIHTPAVLKPWACEEPKMYVPLAWNFYDEIVEKIKSKRPNIADKFCYLDFKNSNIRLT